MTLDEAIRHCEEVAERNETSAITYKNCKEIKTNMYEKLTAEKAESDCIQCAADHRQLAEWLTELKERRSGGWISVKDRLPDTSEKGLGVMYSDCCLVCDSYGWCGMAYYMTDDKESGWEFADAQNKLKIDWTEITHWQPLPEPPKDGEDNE